MCCPCSARAVNQRQILNAHVVNWRSAKSFPPGHAGAALRAGPIVNRAWAMPVPNWPIPHRHPIPHPWLGDDVPGIGGTVPRLAAQPPHRVPQQRALAHPSRPEVPHPPSRPQQRVEVQPPVAAATGLAQAGEAVSLRRPAPGPLGVFSNILTSLGTGLFWVHF